MAKRAKSAFFSSFGTYEYLFSVSLLYLLFFFFTYYLFIYMGFYHWVILFRRNFSISDGNEHIQFYAYAYTLSWILLVSETSCLIVTFQG